MRYKNLECLDSKQDRMKCNSQEMDLQLDRIRKNNQELLVILNNCMSKNNLISPKVRVKKLNRWGIIVFRMKRNQNEIDKKLNHIRENRH